MGLGICLLIGFTLNFVNDAVKVSLAFAVGYCFCSVSGVPATISYVSDYIPNHPVEGGTLQGDFGTYYVLIYVGGISGMKFCCMRELLLCAMREEFVIYYQSPVLY